jgi:hypothetical protein
MRPRLSNSYLLTKSLVAPIDAAVVPEHRHAVMRRVGIDVLGCRSGVAIRINHRTALVRIASLQAG